MDHAPGVGVGERREQIEERGPQDRPRQLAPELRQRAARKALHDEVGAARYEGPL